MNFGLLTTLAKLVSRKPVFVWVKVMGRGTPLEVLEVSTTPIMPIRAYNDKMPDYVLIGFRVK